MTNETSEQIRYNRIYRPKWMFTMHEKEAYFKLKKIVEPLGYTLFAKIRLFDLVEPRYLNEKSQKWLWKIQAKHCDFVLADKKLVARIVIELDDASHDRNDRKERDEFVDSVLKACGYTIIHIRDVDDEAVEAINHAIISATKDRS
jgi:very-short-patch-repair endonuclease